MKKLLLLFAIPILAWSQVTVIQSPTPQFRSFLPSGAPNASGCVYTFTTGTSTPQATYTDFTGNTPNTNPVILDGTGSANIWISGAVYRIQVWSFGSGSVGSNCGNGTQLYQVDGVKDSGLNAFGTGPITVAAISNGIDIFTIIRATDITPTGDFLNFKTFAGSSLFKVDITGAVITSKINNIIYIDGTVFPCTAAGINSAYTALPTAGGTIDARGCQGTITAGGTITIANGKATNLLLGAATWNFGTTCPAITGGNDMSIWGQGPEVSVIQDNCAASVIVSTNTASRFNRWNLGQFSVTDTSGANAGSVAVDFTNITSGRMFMVIGHDVETCFKVDGTGGGAFYNDFYSNVCTPVSSTVTNGFKFTGGANENHVFGGQVKGATNGFIIDNVTHILVDGTSIETFTTGVSIAPSNATVSTHLHSIRCENPPTSGNCILETVNAQRTLIDGVHTVGVTNMCSGCETATDTQFYDANYFSSNIFVNHLKFGVQGFGMAGFAQDLNLYAENVNTLAVRNFGDTVYLDVDVRSLIAKGVGGVQLIGVATPGSAAAGQSNVVYNSTAKTIQTAAEGGAYGAIVNAPGFVNQKAETGAADANVLTYTPPAVVGTYRACMAVAVSSATAGVIGGAVSYKSAGGSTGSSFAMFQNNTAAPALTFTTSVGGDYYGCWVFTIDNSATNIVVSWTGGGTTAAKVSASVERLI